MKIVSKIVFITIFLTTIVTASTLDNKLVGVWKSQPESKDKFTCTFNKDASFTLKAVHKIFHLSTDGKYTIAQDNNKTVLHLYDLDFIFIRNKHYGGLVEFIDENTLKLDLKRAKIDQKVSYPKSFGRGTIIFYRQKS